MKLYVGNLSWQARDEDVRALFEPFGTVESAQVIMERDNPNRSRGIAFVEMPNEEEAKAAIAGLNETEQMGRMMQVNEARPMTDRPPRREYNGGGRDGGYRGGNGGGGFSPRPPRRDFGGSDY